MIRKFKDEDVSFVQENDFFASLMIQYNKDIEKENRFTMTDDEGNVLGVLAFQYHETWYSKFADLNRVCLIIVTKDDDKQVEGELLEYSKKWCDNHREEHKDKKISLCTWVDDQDYDGIQTMICHGLLESQVCPCLKYDLLKEIPEYTLPEGMTIEELSFNEEDVNKFIEFTALANGGSPDSVNQLWFSTGDPTYKVFVVKDKDRIVSSACMWKITDERAAVENISTLPEYRRRNLARCVITHVLKIEKEQGYKISTLSTKGENKNALKLYTSLGFEIYYNQIEMHY